MKKHPWLCFFAILIVAGLVIGITAGDLWQYIIDFIRIGIDLFVKWMDEVIRALRDSITSVTGPAGGSDASTPETTTTLTSLCMNKIANIIHFS